MSTGADNKTMPVTAEYADGHERIFGKREPKRGRWVQHPKTGELIPAEEYVPEVRTYSVGDGIASGRFYENTAATDGTDIGSRKKHREYMRQNGLTTADDFKETWAKATEERRKLRRNEPGSLPSKTRREVIARKLYEIDKP